MGVPTFFRWLSRKYPKIVVDVVEEEWKELPTGERIPPDTSQPNPNGVEFDCLYLDMNGIIHPCFHPENKPQPETEEEILNAIYEYIDRLFAIVRPRRLLYLAIDGVAPRAKMNQQRSRRFRAAKEARQKAEDEEFGLEEMVKMGKLTPEQAQAQRERLAKRLDSNIITPGTAFMEHVAQGLRGYIQRRLTSDPGWQGLTVILSDASVPGEGEHKIMQFIRRQRHQPGYDPNTRHVLYGLDADLIMLALATHEPHFNILREVVIMNTSTNCHRCGRPGHHAAECTAVLPTSSHLSSSENTDTSRSAAPEKRVPYQFLRINVLREYLAKDLSVETPFPYSFERCLDDYVFLCFFVGNDFLPHLPTLEIREGAIDLLVDLYKKLLPSLGGYLTQDGDVCLQRVQRLLEALAPLEDGILRRRREREKILKQRRRQSQTTTATATTTTTTTTTTSTASQQRPLSRSAPAFTSRRSSQSSLSTSSSTTTSSAAPAEVMSSSAGNESDTASANKQAARELRAGLISSDKPSSHLTDVVVKEDEEMEEEEEEEEQEEEEEKESEEDSVRLGEEGWQSRYYEIKFGVKYDDVDFFARIRQAYVQGLVWVQRYYYQGVASWKWFYPFHYAPFTGELARDGLAARVDISKVYEVSEPFRPFEQLLGVLPTPSAHCLPPAFRRLMEDPNSPLAEFYPSDFVIDLNGKRYAWQGVVLLPFIDERKLLDAIADLDATLTEEERRRNTPGYELLFVRQDHPFASTLQSLYSSTTTTTTTTTTTSSSADSADSTPRRLTLPPLPRGGLAGSVEADPYQEQLRDTPVWCGRYFLPPLPPQYERPLRLEELNIAPNTQPPKLPATVPQAPAILLPGVILPPPQLKFYDFAWNGRPRSYEFYNGLDLRHRIGVANTARLPPAAHTDTSMMRTHDHSSSSYYYYSHQHPDRYSHSQQRTDHPSSSHQPSLQHSHYPSHNRYHPYAQPHPHSLHRSDHSNRNKDTEHERTGGDRRSSSSTRQSYHPYYRPPPPPPPPQQLRLSSQSSSPMTFSQTPSSSSRTEQPPIHLSSQTTSLLPPLSIPPTHLNTNLPTTQNTPVPTIPTPLPPLGHNSPSSPSISTLLSLVAPNLLSLLSTTTPPAEAGGHLYQPLAQPSSQTGPPPPPHSSLASQSPPLNHRSRGGYQPPYASKSARGGSSGGHHRQPPPTAAGHSTTTTQPKRSQPHPPSQPHSLSQSHYSQQPPPPPSHPQRPGRTSNYRFSPY